MTTFVYQPDVVSTNNSFSRLVEAPKPSGVVDLSFCVQILLYIYKPSIAYVFESGRHDPYDPGVDFDGIERFNLLFSLTAEGTWVGVKSHNFFTESGVMPLEWNHFCFAHNANKKSILMMKNGETVLNITNNGVFDDTPMPKDFLDNLVLGQRQHLLRDPVLSLSGEISNFYLWTRELSEPEMRSISSCRSRAEDHPEKLVVNWTENEWTHRNVQVRNRSLYSDATCVDRMRNRQGNDNLVMFPEKRQFVSARQLCRTLKGTLSVPETFTANEALHEASMGNFSVCNRRHLEYIWLGIVDGATEGIWVHESDGRKLRETSVGLPGRNDSDGWKVPWETRPQEPNGGTKENCAAMKRGKTWIDIECDFQLCTVCNFSTSTPRLKLRGLCSSGKSEGAPGLPQGFDDHYTMNIKAYKGGKHFFQGYYGSEISWNDQDMVWMLKSPYEPHYVAIHNASSDYPFGKKIWFFKNESSCSNLNDMSLGIASAITRRGSEALLLNQGQDQGQKIKILKLTACGSDEFTCDDGTCISMSGRCNHRQDCRDYSDEFDCKLIGLQSRHYIKDYAPGNIDDSRGGVTEVRYKVEIVSLNEVKELGMTMSVQFRLTMAWFDPRMVFYNLKADDSLNALTQEEKMKIWIPSIVFNNTDDENESIVDEKTNLVVQMKGNFSLSSVSDPDEKFIFSGSDNPIVYKRHHNIQFQCNFDLSYYPFDIQRCKMIFLRNQKAGKFVLKPEDLEPLVYLGERELLQYHINDWSFSAASDSGFEIAITLKRRYLYQLLTTYLPSLCLFCIIHATQYFKVSFFHTRIMVSLTGMLVMTTLFLNTSASLPKTSYFKMIDIWMVFGLLLPFFEVVLHTVTDYKKKEVRPNFRDEENEEIVINPEQNLLLRVQNGRIRSSMPFINGGGSFRVKANSFIRRNNSSIMMNNGDADLASIRANDVLEEEETAPREGSHCQGQVPSTSSRIRLPVEESNLASSKPNRSASQPLLRMTSRTFSNLFNLDSETRKRDRSRQNTPKRQGSKSWLAKFLRCGGDNSTADDFVDDPDADPENVVLDSTNCRSFSRRQEITTRISRTVVPAVVLVFNLIYWTVAFWHD